MSAVVSPLSTGFQSHSMEAAFPEVDPGHIALGSRVLIQLKSPPTKSKGGIILSDTDAKTDRWNTTVGKVISLGPVAFRNRKDLTEWAPNQSAKVGDFVRIARYDGERYSLPVPGDRDAEALFVFIEDVDVTAIVTMDPLEVRAYYA